jgi:FixJ family two-component response regulator
MVTDRTVFVVDDDEGMRISVRRLLETAGLKVETFADAASFLNACDPQRPGCLLLDVCMPGMNGLELQAALNERGITLPVIIMTAYGDVPKTVQAFKAGGYDFIEKPFQADHILDRVRTALELDAGRRAEHDRLAEIRSCYNSLTARERDVMTGVVGGHLNKQIAAELNVSPKTVELHRAHVMQKMKASSLAELVQMYMTLQQVGLQTPRPLDRPSQTGFSA